MQVADALSKSEALEVSEEKDHVRRAEPLKESAEMMMELDERTVYFHPLPFDSTLDGLTQFFNTVGPVRCVRMRRHPNTKDFRGSVFVEFETKEIAEEVSSSQSCRHSLDALLPSAGARARLPHKSSGRKRVPSGGLCTGCA